MIKYSLILLILSLFSCATGTSRLIDEEKLNFSYTDDGYLFFRNMRQSTYDIQVMEKEGLRTYQHEDFQNDQFLKTKMVVNWKMDRAYMLIDLPDSIRKSDIKVLIQGSEDSLKEISQPNWRRQGELVFLTRIYNAIIKEEKLWLSYSGIKSPLFISTDDQEAFRISMYDFFRLSGVL